MATSSETDLYQTDMAWAGDFVRTPTGDLDTMTGLANYRNAIMRRIFTVPGAIVHRPEYGVGLPLFLNGINTTSVRQRLAQKIQEQLERDPRTEKFLGLRVEQSARNPSLVTIYVSVKPVGYAEISVGISSEGI